MQWLALVTSLKWQYYQLLNMQLVAYRLHFERTNMKTVEALELGKIGIPNAFQFFVYAAST